MLATILLIVATILIGFFIFIKITGTPRKFARSLAGPLLLCYRLERQKNPSATEEELAWEIVKARIANPISARGLTLDEAGDYLKESTNIADVLCAICIRDLIGMRRYESVYPAVAETLKFIAERGYYKEVQASKTFQGYEKPEYFSRWRSSH